MNFVAVLAVLAASAFTLPLLVQGGEALGLARGASVVASLVVALALALGLVTRAVVALRLRELGRPGSGDVRSAPSAAPDGPRAQPAALVDAKPQAVRAGLRLLDAEEERHAGL